MVKAVVVDIMREGETGLLSHPIPTLARIRSDIENRMLAGNNVLSRELFGQLEEMSEKIENVIVDYELCELCDQGNPPFSVFADR